MPENIIIVDEAIYQKFRYRSGVSRSSGIYGESGRSIKLLIGMEV